MAVAIAAALSMLLPALAVAAGASVLDVPTPAQPPAPLGEVVPVEVPAEPAPPDPGTVIVDTPPVTPGDGTVVEAPAPPPAELPGIEVPVTGGTPLPSAAPEPPAVATTPLPTTPDLPLAPPPAAASLPAPERLVTAVAATAELVISVAPTAPDQPIVTTVKVATSAPAKAVAKAPRRPASLAELVPNLLTPPGAAEGTSREFGGAVSVPKSSRSAITPTRSSESTIFDTRLAPPASTPPAGSSLLAILAGYALPGGGGVPASTLVLFIVVGLIVGLGCAACAQGTERIALGRLLGAASGHRPAVCRPG